MHQKDRFVTTLSKSGTSKTSTGEGVESSIQFVKGVGPGLGAIFHNRGLSKVKDLLFFFPRTYEDRSQVMTISALTEGVKATLSVKVLSQKQIPIRKFGRSMLEVRCTDDTGTISLKWFHAPRGMERKFVAGLRIVVTGKVTFYLSQPQIVHPEITWDAGADGAASEDSGSSASASSSNLNPNVGRVVPIYTEIEGIPTRTLRKVLWEALQKYGNDLEEDIPAVLLERRQLPPLAQAVYDLHFPPEHPQFGLESLASFQTPSHRRLIYGEFFKFEYLMLQKKLQAQHSLSPPLGPRQGIEGRERVKNLKAMLPFQLTAGQFDALKELLEDFIQPFPMNRMIQGDVGSGKTVLVFLSAAFVLAEGGQAALMVPTEILAEQHFKNAIKLFQGNLNVALLVGKTSVAERTSIQSRLSKGEPLLIIGTHALLEDSVSLPCLDYVVIDEQHRFGVEQRGILRKKGTRSNLAGQEIIPHSLILSATPIPRTLALTFFGDLSVTSIRDLPPGRSPIQTKVVRTSAQRSRVFEQIRKEIGSGRQAYFIYPLINESEAEGFTHLKSAVAQTAILAEEVFPDFSVGLLHGQMSPDEKAHVMEKFKKGETQILVSTTVVEVGVDVPNATVMAIEHAERFGLSQLHQLRGRVGRGQFQSYCFLFCAQAQKDSPTSQRLEVLEETNNGFKIAEADLEIRGPGEFLGTRQAGALPFLLANLVRDHEILIQARDDAAEIIKMDPYLARPENKSLRHYIERDGKVQFERLSTS